MKWPNDVMELETTEAPAASTGAGEPTPPSGGEKSDSGPPETIPYARFKEVNDARKDLESQLAPYKQLEDMGFGADDLSRLANWEVQFGQDPSGNWMEIAGQLDGIPDGVKLAIEQASKTTPTAEPSQPASEPSPSSEPDDSTPPQWAQPLLDDYQTRQEKEVQAEKDQILNSLLDQWEEKDKEEGLIDDEGNSLTPKETKLTFIVSAARSAKSVDEILDLARGEANSYREKLLQSQIKLPSRDNPPPASVPGGGASASVNTGEKPRTLSDANKLAVAAARKRLDEGDF